MAVTKDGIKKPESISDLQYLLLWRKYLLWHFAVERKKCSHPRGWSVCLQPPSRLDCQLNEQNNLWTEMLYFSYMSVLLQQYSWKLYIPVRWIRTASLMQISYLCFVFRHVLTVKTLVLLRSLCAVKIHCSSEVRKFSTTHWGIWFQWKNLLVNMCSHWLLDCCESYDTMTSLWTSMCQTCLL